MLVRTSLFLTNRAQAVGLPKAVAFEPEVVILSEDSRRTIAPTDAAWDDFFEAGGPALRGLARRLRAGEKASSFSEEKEAKRRLFVK